MNHYLNRNITNTMKMESYFLILDHELQYNRVVFFKLNKMNHYLNRNITNNIKSLKHLKLKKKVEVTYTSSVVFYVETT